MDYVIVTRVHRQDGTVLVTRKKHRVHEKAKVPTLQYEVDYLVNGASVTRHTYMSNGTTTIATNYAPPRQTGPMNQGVIFQGAIAATGGSLERFQAWRNTEPPSYSADDATDVCRRSHSLPKDEAINAPRRSKRRCEEPATNVPRRSKRLAR